MPSARGLRVVEILVLQEFCAHESSDPRPARHADDHHDVENAAFLNQRRERENQEKRRKTDHHFDETAHGDVDPATEVARESAEDDADGDVDADGHDANGERDANAVKHAREHVATFGVGAEPVLDARREDALRRVRFAVGERTQRKDGERTLARGRQPFDFRSVIHDTTRVRKRIVEWPPVLGRDDDERREKNEREQREQAAANARKAPACALFHDEISDRERCCEDEQEVEQHVDRVFEHQPIEERAGPRRRKSARIAVDERLVRREQRCKNREHDEQRDRPEPPDGHAILLELAPDERETADAFGDGFLDGRKLGCRHS
jgi:hypothetical protein